MAHERSAAGAASSWWDRFRAELRGGLLRYAGYLALWFGLLILAVVKGAQVSLAFGVVGTAIVVGLLLVQALLRTPLSAARAAAQAAPVHHHQMDSYREVVETIVFVVVLVLLLKSFAAEAFVIPTGSMAETLYGYQKIVKCPECGYSFPVNCSSEVDPSEGSPQPVVGCTCPNCLQEIYWDASPDYADRHPRAVKIPNPGWNSGDRVLVSKFQYDLLQRLPDRLDVVVFKYPGDSDFPRSGPNKNLVPMNYIKRLVGEPGETIAIHGGNLYRLPAGAGLTYPEVKGLEDPDLVKRESARKLLWRRSRSVFQQRRFNGPADDGADNPEHGPMFEDFPAARERFDAGQFEIIRKKPAQVLSMKRVVYDNDHQAKDLTGATWQRWVGDAGWGADGVQGFKSVPASGGELAWLRYRHILRGNGGQPSLITDFMGYNSWVTARGDGHRGNPGENWVGDLVLECEAVIERPAGKLVLELVKGVDRFQARWDLAGETCTLVRITGGREQELETKRSALKAGTYQLRFANVDQRLTVWVDEELVYGDGVVYPAVTGPDREHPDRQVPLEMPTKDDLQPVSVGASGAAVAVRHLRLFRDTYYTVKASSPDVYPADFLHPETWTQNVGTLPLKTLYVQPGHFLCLGDNSPESSDGRTWGLVPDRLLLGRALLVYYPVNRAGRIR